MQDNWQHPPFADILPICLDYCSPIFTLCSFLFTG